MQNKLDKIKTKKDSKRAEIDVSIDRDCLVIKLSGVLTIRTIDSILNKLSVLKKSISKKENTLFIENMLLDISDLYPARLGGVMGLVCLCSALVKNQIDEVFKPAKFFIRRPSEERVLIFLVNLNFFTWMTEKAKLLGCEGLVQSEYERERQRERNLYNTNYKSDYDTHPVFWPMTQIPCKGKSIADQDFENVAQHFLNRARDCFEKLFSSSRFNFSDANIHDFWGANYELYDNIFEHSKSSLSLVAIHANSGYPINGAIVCYYDIGIGFKESVNTTPGIEKKFKTDLEAIKWALLDGHTSNPNRIRHDGHGLTIVQELVLNTGGILEIRSGKCLLQRKSKEPDWKAYIVPWFPGSQISFFVPCQR